MTPYCEFDGITLYLGDCREVTEWLTADVLVTDPPYGIGLDYKKRHLSNANPHEHVEGDGQPFDPVHLLAAGMPSVIFGGQNFSSRLPDSGHWIVWDKITRNGVDVRLSECELAWTQGVLGRTRCFRHMWSGAFRDSERGTSYHPTQKPVALMAWVLSLCPPGVIADPYSGSGSTLVAARLCGRRAIGVEIEERYCELIAERLAQGVLL